MLNYKAASMKRIMLAFVSFSISLTLSAQHHERRDSLTFAQLKTLIMRVPVLTGQTQPQIIVPHQRLCFNVEFDFKIGVGSRIAEQSMFINSSMGITGYLPPSTDGLINMIMPEIPKFSFSVIGMKGNVYRYYNQKGNHDVLEHYVTTGNTQTYQYTTTITPGGGADLLRKSETGTYCNGNMTATAYRAEAGGATWFIYGDHFPAKLHPKKYLGNFGIGYLLTEEGLFIITEMRTGAVQCKLTDIQNSNACFDTQPFVLLEDKFNTKAAADLQRENDKIARDEAQVSDHCVAEQMAVINFRKENQRKQEENLRRSKEGNMYQDAGAQKAMLGMMDPLISVQEGILSTKVSICNTHYRMATASQSEQPRLSEKLRCLNQQLADLQQMETQMRALETQYASNPARVLAEKGRLFSHFIPCG